MGRPLGSRNKDKEPEIEFFDTEPSELEQTLSGLPADDCKILLFRVKQQGRAAYVDEFSPSDFSLQTIKELYGGGVYKLTTKGAPGGSKHYRIELEGLPTTPQKLVKAVDNAGRIVFINKQKGEELAQQAAVQASNDPNAVNPVNIVLMNELRAIRESLQNQNGKANHGDDRRAFLEELVMYKNLFSPPQNPVGDMSKTVTELISKGLELGARAADGDAGGWSSIIEKLMPVAEKALSAIMAHQNRMTQPHIAGPAQVSLPSHHGIGETLPSASGKPAEQNASGFSSIAPLLGPHMPLVIASASVDSDPNSWADIILPQISEEQKPQVIEWLKSDKWLPDLISLDQRVQHQQGWWNNLRDILLGDLTNEAEPEAEDEETP
jgi:hypothetical protein